MKAIAVFPETHEVKLIDHEEPKITTPTQVKLRMLEVGVCGTDRKITSFQFGTPPAGSEYLVIGHESLGEVVEVGPEVRDIKPGDLVVTTVRRPCPHEYCRACRMGHQDFCFTGDFTECGIKEAHGFMTEFVVDEGRHMNVVPRELRDVGVLTEPLTVAEKAMAQVWQIQQRLPWIDPNTSAQMRGKGLKAMVLGAGPVGQLGTMVLVAAGFETYVYSRSKKPNAKADLVEAIEVNIFPVKRHRSSSLLSRWVLSISASKRRELRRSSLMSCESWGPMPSSSSLVCRTAKPPSTLIPSA